MKSWLEPLTLPRPVLVQKAWYEEVTDSVFWDIKFQDSGREATLMWVREEFGFAFNIPYQIPPPHVIEFCKKMEGKTVNLRTPESIK